MSNKKEMNTAWFHNNTDRRIHRLTNMWHTYSDTLEVVNITLYLEDYHYQCRYRANLRSKIIESQICVIRSEDDFWIQNLFLRGEVLEETSVIHSLVQRYLEEHGHYRMFYLTEDYNTAFDPPIRFT